MTNMKIDDKTSHNSPSLRFPEFTGEWEEFSLGEIGDSFIGLTYKPTDTVPSGGIIVFRSSNIQDGCIDYKDIVRVNKKVRENLITKNGDLLICARNGSSRLIGKNALLHRTDANQTFGAFMMVFRSDKNHFVHHLLNTKRYTSQVAENLGARINQITISDLSSFRFFFPKDDKEMTRIASLFDLLDGRIAVQNRLIDRLQSLMIGIAQKIAHSNKPNVRISDCLECSSSALQESEVNKTGKYPVYGANGIVGYIDKYHTQNEAIYIIKDGSGVGGVSYVTGKCSSTGTLNILQAKNGHSLKYLYYLLKVFNFVPYKTGMAIPHIYFKDYGKAKIFCPAYPEQLEYVKLLSSIDGNLRIALDSLKNFNLQKQYLLRHMLI